MVPSPRAFKDIFSYVIIDTLIYDNVRYVVTLQNLECISIYPKFLESVRLSLEVEEEKYRI